MTFFCQIYKCFRQARDKYFLTILSTSKDNNFSGKNKINRLDKTLMRDGANRMEEQLMFLKPTWDNIFYILGKRDLHHSEF